MSNEETANDVATARSLRWPLLVLAAGIIFAVAPFLSGLVGALIGPLVLSCFVELLPVYDEARTGMRARVASE